MATLNNQKVLIKLGFLSGDCLRRWSRILEQPFFRETGLFWYSAPWFQGTRIQPIDGDIEWIHMKHISSHPETKKSLRVDTTTYTYLCICYSMYILYIYIYTWMYNIYILYIEYINIRMHICDSKLYPRSSWFNPPLPLGGLTLPPPLGAAVQPVPEDVAIGSVEICLIQVHINNISMDLLYMI